MPPIDRARPRPSAAATLIGLAVLLTASSGLAGCVRNSASAPDVDTTPGNSAAATSSALEPAAPPPLPLTGRTIVLDPGHNRDNGRFPAEINRQVDAGGFPKACNTTGTATNSGVPEGTVNWDLALAVRERLEVLGATVVLTREQNVGWGPCIDERAGTANRAAADLLLSLHADGAAAGAHGFHVITPGLRAGWTDDIAAESGRAGVVLRDALIGAGLTPATYIGEAGIDQRTDLGTLNRADVPAVMLEAGNLRNVDDATLLTEADGRARVADALAQAVCTFLAE